MFSDISNAHLPNVQRNSSGTLFQEQPNKDDGYFSSKSMIRRINREALVLLGGGRSILLQLAHPFVAAGVNEHSNFQEEILNRLYRTLLFMHSLVVKNRRHVEEILSRFHTMHIHIQGRLPHAAGHFPAGMPYSGTDPLAKLWVHATFVDTALKVYEQFVTALSLEERQDYYADTLIVGHLLGIPPEILPSGLEAFQEYMASMLSGDTLEVTETARQLADAVLYPNVGLLPAVSAKLLRFVTAGILPERFRSAYALPWGKSQQFKLDCFCRFTRTLRPFVPARVWQNPFLEGKLARILLWGMSNSLRPQHFNT